MSKEETPQKQAGDLEALPPRLMRRLFTLEQDHPVDGCLGIVPLAAAAALGLEQSLLLVVAQRADAHARSPRELADPHRTPPVVISGTRLDPDVSVRF